MVWSEDLPEVPKDTCLFQPGFVGSSNWTWGAYWRKCSDGEGSVQMLPWSLPKSVVVPLLCRLLCRKRAFVFIERHLRFLLYKGHYSSGFSAYGATNQSCTWKLSWWVWKISVLWPRETFNPCAHSFYYAFSSRYKSLSHNIMRCKWQALWVGIRNAGLVIYKLMVLFS